VAILTVEEVAQKLKVSTKAVYNLINTKQLPVFRIGKIKVRIDEEILDNFIKEKSSPIKPCQ
jgi:excisionase family DNA binding protein